MIIQIFVQMFISLVRNVTDPHHLQAAVVARLVQSPKQKVVPLQETLL